MTKHTNTPELRFPGFRDEWKATKLGNILEDTNIKENHDAPLYSLTVENGITEKTERYNREFLVKKNNNFKIVKPFNIVYNPMNITLGAIDLHSMDKEIKVSGYYNVLRIINQTNPFFLINLLKTYKSILLFKKVATGSLREKQRVHFSEFKNLKKYLPSYIEQEKIGSFFSKLDRHIELEEKKLELLEQQKRGYIQQLYSQEIRFKNDKGENYPEWKLTELNAIFTKYQNTIYLKDEQEYKRISISNRGIISHRDITLGKEIGRKRQYVIDLNNHPNTLTFIRQGVFLGGIGFVPEFLNNYIVTENMPLLSMDSKYNKLFMTYLFESEDYYKNVIFKNLPIGSAQKALHEKEWLQSTVSVPILEEQEKIGNFFNKTDNLIELQTKKVESLKQRKRGLLQKMFV